MTDLVFLYGVALANYRGIGEELQLIGPFKRFNFFIGPNNSGKSCILNFIAHHLKPWVWDEQGGFSREEKKELDSLDVHLRAHRSQVKMGVAVPISKCKEYLLNRPNQFQRVSNVSFHERLRKQGLEETLDNVYALMETHGGLWLGRHTPDRRIALIDREVLAEEMSAWPDQNMLVRLWSLLKNRDGREFDRQSSLDIYREIIASIRLDSCPIAMVPAIRQISPAGHDFSDLSGAGLIDELARLQNPANVLKREELVKKFERINDFLKIVTEHDDAKIEIPHNRESVLVHMDNKVLPLSSLGTGIHEVVMLAAFCTLKEQQIVCIEEPEIHLHPVLQRRLIEYLDASTDNQYFIATHSASFIDMPGASVFHVANKDGLTKVQAAIDSSSKFDICRDLGYKASDILQANAIIWVEGPSDRIYIQHWIKELTPELREGIDYSIMFYGGRLLSHLHTNDPDTADEDIQSLIAVRRLNRHLAVVIDSDKDKADKPINATKRRILDELAEDGGTSFGWLTAGREIENYVSEEKISKALLQCYPNFSKCYKKGQFEHVLPFKNINGELVKEVDKVRVARVVCAEAADLDVLDLREQIGKLVAVIRQANR